MLRILLSDKAAGALRTILAREAADARVRVRESRVGTC